MMLAVVMLSDSCFVCCAVLFNCVTPDAVFVLRVIIALCFIVVILSLSGFLMDTTGPTHVVCRAIRFTASLSILSGDAVLWKGVRNNNSNNNNNKCSYNNTTIYLGD